MKKLKLGVIGIGAVVREIYQHLYFSSEYSPFISIEAVADTNQKLLDEFCDQHNIGKDKRFTDYKKMIDSADLDAVQCNTPDSFHEQPAIYALNSGLDVTLPKPLADTIKASHNMIEAAKKNERLLGVDFHKRDDQRIRQAAARFANGDYGRFQLAVFYMLDKLLVADPNHQPRFFASDDFAEKNTPITFLTVHMADSLLQIVPQKPVKIHTRAWSQKLPSLKPLPIDGYDMCDTEIVFEDNSLAHIITGWHLPNTTPSISYESMRLIGTDGMVDMKNSDYSQITESGVTYPNFRFMNFDKDGVVRGFGMSRPGDILKSFLKNKNGELDENTKQKLMQPGELGFWSSAVIEAAQESLNQGDKTTQGVIHGKQIDLPKLIKDKLGSGADNYL